MAPPAAMQPAAMAPSAICPNPATDALPKILQARCGDLCHRSDKGPAQFAAKLDLYSPGAKQRLLNIPASQCQGKVLIQDKADGVTGHIFDKVAGAVPNCGERMPPFGDALNADEIKCLKDWIRAR